MRVQYLNPEGTCPAQGLYSHVTRVSGGSLYFVAGQLSVGSDGGVVGRNDFDAQFHQVFQNLESVLKGVRCGFPDIVKFTTYLAHSQHIEAFMRMRSVAFPKMFAGEVFPPNTLLVVDRLVKEDFLFEVEAVVAASEA